MAEILHAPDREHLVTTNAWAFMHWVRTVQRVDLCNWTMLQRWSGTRPDDFRAAVARFARLPEHPVRLIRHAGTREALVLRQADGSRLSRTRDDLLAGYVNLPPSPDGAGTAALVTAITRCWPTHVLIRPLADVLLHADVRPDDRLLIFGPAWPWLAALLEGAAVILAGPTTDMFALAAEERATIVVAPANNLAGAAFQRPRRRHELARLRTVFATGGPLSAEGRRRLYTWVKSDLMLLAHSGDTYWGNPLEPVVAQPPAYPALLKPPASAPATR